MPLTACQPQCGPNKHAERVIKVSDTSGWRDIISQVPAIAKFAPLEGRKPPHLHTFIAYKSLLLAAPSATECDYHGWQGCDVAKQAIEHNFFRTAICTLRERANWALDITIVYMPLNAASMRPYLAALLACAALALVPSAQATFQSNCYRNGYDVWFLQEKNWPTPINLCPRPTPVIFFRWRGRHGVWQLPSAACPSQFAGNATDNSELAPVAEGVGSASGMFQWVLPGPGVYYATSQAPGDCESGMVVTVNVIPDGGTSAAAAPSLERGQGWAAVGMLAVTWLLA